MSPTDWQALLNLASIAAGIGILLAGTLGLYLLWYLAGRDKIQPSSRDFVPSPPDNTPPGMVGALVDERVDQEDLLATLLDLARRGYLDIKAEITGDYTLNRSKKSAGGLRTYEKAMLSALFAGGEQSMLSGFLQKPESVIENIKAYLNYELVRAGFLQEGPPQTRQAYARLGYILLLTIGVVGFFAYSYIRPYVPFFQCVVWSSLVVALGLIFISRYMPKKSEKGAFIVPQWLAFRRYLEQIDRYTGVTEAAAQFEQYLPYAVAFGLEKIFLQKFTHARVPAPTWYRMAPGLHRPYRTGTTLRPASSYWDPLPRGPRAGVSAGKPDIAPAARPQVEKPGLDQASQRAFSGLDEMGGSLFNMLNAAGDVFSGTDGRERFTRRVGGDTLRKPGVSQIKAGSRNTGGRVVRSSKPRAARNWFGSGSASSRTSRGRKSSGGLRVRTSRPISSQRSSRASRPTRSRSISRSVSRSSSRRSSSRPSRSRSVSRSRSRPTRRSGGRRR
jgi:hypothetical protein